jgi:hypothetical protein
MNHPDAGRSSHDEERPMSAIDELLHTVEDAETDVVDDGQRGGKDRVAADALSPSEDAQEDSSRRRF